MRAESLILPRKAYRVPLPDGRLLRLGVRTLVMGVINVTPDSFADGGRGQDPGRAIEAAREMERQGADILDIGGESTRPGAEPVTVEEEAHRVLPVITALARSVRVPLSVDTYKADVARLALEAGASLVNDISGLQYDSALGEVVAARGAGLILMHNRGRSRDMYRHAAYGAIQNEVRDELSAALDRAVTAGVARERILVDPGLGFAKRAAQSFAALAHVHVLSTLDRPLLVGPSRKSFLALALGQGPAEQREWGTAAAVSAAVLLGAHVVRVHAVPEMVDVVRVADAIRNHATGLVAEGDAG